MAGDSIYSVSRSDDCLSHFVQEHGSLRVSGDTQSRFIGSSSGVYFVNTVRQAVARSCRSLQSLTPEDPSSNPSPEDCIATDEDNEHGIGVGASRATGDVSRGPGYNQANTGVSPNLSRLPIERPPSRDAARILFMTYFQTWHRFFPFVQGPVASKDLEILYSDVTDFSSTTDTGTGPTFSQKLPPARLIILLCLFNLAALHSEVDLPAESRIHHPIHLLSHLISDATKGDLISIQALFAVELLLVARMSLRPAATVAGLLSRLIFLAGLHRCPVRYAEIAIGQADIRKRLFWCIYVLDRFLSQSLGHPLGILDSDIDVCLLDSPELHHRSLQSATDVADSTKATTLSGDRIGLSGAQGNQKAPGRDAQGLVDDRNLILASQVNYFRLMGRSLELFHKSIHVRFIDPSTVLSLRTALEAFWNSLPSDLQDFGTSVGETQPRRHDGQVFHISSFFSLLHNHLRLLLYRPWLSLEPTSPDFQSALQTCISVSRDIICNTKKQRSLNYALFWPGHLSAIWMAGIILVFASHLQLYPADKSQMEIGHCLDALESISRRWPLAKNCHAVLSDLQRVVQQERGSE
ncbi:fungal-specific transcription factor domain-containing protein [Xylaria digitata]|nr:fungal-specific transcription factor domain-containing protein [Xylaria digitata]